MTEAAHTDSMPEHYFVLLAGLQLDSAELSLGPGLVLRRLEEPISVFDLAAAGATGFREWAVLEPLAFACVCEIESDRSAVQLPGYDSLNRVWLASALLILRGFGTHVPVACSAYSWRLIAGHSKGSGSSSDTKLPQFNGGLLDYHLRVLTTPSLLRNKLRAEDAQWVSTHFETFNRIASESSSFRLALEAAVDWRFAKEPRTAVARLWSGIESLFGISSELVYRISILSASLLEERGQRRKERFEEVKRLYGLRSKAVHGDDISEGKLNEALDGSFRLLSDVLLISIEKGRALSGKDFDEALFW
jgi:hypothetical protein